MYKRPPSASDERLTQVVSTNRMRMWSTPRPLVSCLMMLAKSSLCRSMARTIPFQNVMLCLEEVDQTFSTPAQRHNCKAASPHHLRPRDENRVF